MTEIDTDEYDLLAEEPTEFWVCMPCFTLNPSNFGAIHVPGGVKGRVWCPWCGDAMDPDIEDVLTPEEVEQVHSLKPEGANV